MKKYAVIPIIIGLIFFLLTRKWDITIVLKLIILYIIEIAVNSALVSIDHQNGEPSLGDTERHRFWLTVFWPFLFFMGLMDMFD